MDQVIAFGDSMNDKSMFEVAGLAIAMGMHQMNLSNMQMKLRWTIMKMVFHMRSKIVINFKISLNT